MNVGPPQILWFHCIDLGAGEVTPGQKPIPWIEAEAAIYFKHGVRGKSVLDIGAWDGAYTFAAERYGARDVLATDDYCWTGKAWAGRATKAGFDFAHKRLGSKARSQIIDVPAISPEAIGGQFDLVLIPGVLYHVKDPLVCIERAASVTRETLVIETVTGFNDLPDPLMRYLRPGELHGDNTNFFVLNTACLDAMLRDLGFRAVEFTPNPNQPTEALGFSRHIIHATR